MTAATAERIASLLERLPVSAGSLQTAELGAADARNGFYSLVREAAAAGLDHQRIANVTGYTRQRIQQIVSGRRSG